MHPVLLFLYFVPVIVATVFEKYEQEIPLLVLHIVAVIEAVIAAALASYFIIAQQYQ